MRREKPVDQTVYRYLFPNPTPQDPPSFAFHLARNLVPEIRIEVATFYGDLATIEARYPGLDYTHPSHRMRLGRFKHHKRLFSAFENLGLTDGEITSLVMWEGSKWARERYEADEGIKVKDTTGNEIGPFVDRRYTKQETDKGRKQSITKRTDIEILVEDADSNTSLPLVATSAEVDANMSDADDSEESEADDETVTEEQAVEVALVERLDAARTETRQNPLPHQRTVQRLIEAWENGQNLDPDLAQFFKDQSERGLLAYDMDLSGFVSSWAMRDGTAPAATTQRAAA